MHYAAIIAEDSDVWTSVFQVTTSDDDSHDTADGKVTYQWNESAPDHLPFQVSQEWDTG